jgi:leukotriene-A4 hydrolase
VSLTALPPQTPRYWCAEGTHPYLFSQCQAIHARSLVPCQDMPAVKMSYSATVWVPEELTALMSAVPVDEGAPQDEHAKERTRLQPETAGMRAFHFVQAVPIPSYLLALAAGKLVSQVRFRRCRKAAKVAGCRIVT